MDRLEEVIELRKNYTAELYSPEFTKELLWKLYEFINSDLVEEEEWFSNYDKAALLVAYELLSNKKKKQLPINTRKIKSERTLISPKTQELIERSEKAISQLRSELLK